MLKLTGGIVGEEVQVPADQVEEALRAPTGVHGHPVVARAVVDEDGLVAVSGDRGLELFGDFIKRLIPRNAFELPVASFADALQRILETIRRIESLAHRPTAQTSTNLRENAACDVACIVGFNTNHPAVTGGKSKGATTAAIDRTGGPRPGLKIGYRLADRFGQRREGEGCERARQSRKLQETAAGK